MLMRIWHGATLRENGDAFSQYLMETGVPWYLSCEGNKGVLVLRKDEQKTSEFLLLSLWDSSESIQKFAGHDINRAVYNFSKDRELLVELEPQVMHYRVVANLCPAGSSEIKPIKYSIIV